MKNYYNEFLDYKDSIFRRIPLCKKIFSVDIKIIDSRSIFLNKELSSLQARNPGPLIVFNFINEYLLLRLENLCVILHTSILNKFKPFNNTDYLPLIDKDEKLLNQYYPSLNFSAKNEMYYQSNNEVYYSTQNLIKPKNENMFLQITIFPLLLYLIKRFDYPRNLFQDPSFFDFNSDLDGKKKKKVTSIKFNSNDFIIIQRIGTMTNYYDKCIHIQTANIFVIKTFREDFSLIDREIEFNKRNKFPMFVKFYGYFRTGTNQENTKLVFEYMAKSEMKYYCQTADNFSKLINFFRIAYSIDYLHSNGYIYRNLKNHKILFNNEGLAFLSNFSYVCEETEIESVDNQVGSDLYASPEQTNGKLTIESDIYSFGKSIIFLFNGHIEISSVKFDHDYGLLNNIIESCLNEKKECRPSIKYIISKFNDIIDSFPINEEEKIKAKKCNKEFNNESIKYINGKSILKLKEKDTFLNQLFDINLYKVESLDCDETILQSFLNNDLLPFITCDIQIINQLEYLIIGFELSCLIVRKSILKENDNFYLNKILNKFDSEIKIYPISQDKISLISNLFNSKIIINDDTFFEMIKKSISLSNEKIRKIPELLQKIFPSLIGYSIKRFYFKKIQFDDPFFFDYDEICRDLSSNSLKSDHFYCLKVFNENRFIVYNTIYNQLFMVISSYSKYFTQPFLKDESHHPYLAKYLGSVHKNFIIKIMTMNRIKSFTKFYHFFEIVSDFTLNDYLTSKSNILDDPTYRTKILADILFGLDFANNLYKFDEVSRILIDTKYIFFDQFNNIKMVFPYCFDYDTIKENLMNIALILLSFYYRKEYIDLSNDKKKFKKYFIPKSIYPLYYIYHICTNFEEEINDRYKKINLIIDILQLISNDYVIFESTNQNVIAKDFAKFKKYELTFDYKLCMLSIKLKSDYFFKDLSLPKSIKEFSIYYLRPNNGLLIQDILQQKTPPLATFFLNKIRETMKLILTFNKIIIIYDINDNYDNEFVNKILMKWENKALFPIDEGSMKNFNNSYSSISEKVNILYDKKLNSIIPNISSKIYNQAMENTLEYECFKTIILYLIKRFEFKSTDFEDSSFFKSPFNSFTVFNQNDFFYLYSIGFGSTSNIELSLHKQTLHLFAIKKYYPTFQKSFDIELNMYSTNFDSFCPFITKCYGYIRNSSMLIFEYMLNGNFNQIKMNENINSTTNTKIMLRVLSSINYLHSKGILYKDLKPENILFNQDFEPFLTDLGEISSIDNISFSTGNILFAAPEFVNKKVTKYPTKIDIFSFGRFLGYMCTSSYEMSKTLPAPYNVLQDVYSQCTQENPKFRLNSIDLLFDLIYNERFFPETEKEQIKDLILEIIEFNFKNHEIYKPFLYARGIFYNKDVILALYLSTEYEKEIMNNEYLCFELGNLYFNEFNDQIKAIELYQKASDKGNDKATNLLGVFYFRGKYLKRDFEKSLTYFEKVMERNSDALNNYGYTLMFGISHPQSKDIEKAQECFQNAIQKYNKKESYVNLGDLYSGYNKTKNFSDINLTKAINYYLKACKFKYDIPFIRLALLCIIEDGTIDKKDSNYYFQEALKLNKNIETYRHMYQQSFNVKFKLNEALLIECLLNLKKYFKLGMFYYKKNDLNNAKHYFHLASKESDSHASNYLGFIYFKEEKIRQISIGKSQSIKYFKKAVQDKQNIISQYNLGLVYLLYKSFRKSIHFLSIAANKNHFKANYKLGEIYENFQNMNKAIYYYERALALNKKCFSLYNKLGVIYAIGKGIDSDKAKAKEYLEKASGENLLLARNNLAILLLYFFKREQDIRDSIGMFFSLHRDYGLILASCNLGFFYENRGELYDSIPYFNEALTKFKSDFLDKNRIIINQEEQECVHIIIFLTYLMVLGYFLNSDYILNSERLFNLHLNNALSFYQKYKFNLIIDELNLKYEVEIKNRINPYFDKFCRIRNENKSKSFEFDFSNQNKSTFLYVLNEQIRIFKQEIRSNNYEILFLSHSKYRSNKNTSTFLAHFYSGFFDIPSNETIFSINDFVKNLLSQKCTDFNFEIPIYLRFRELYPNEKILHEIFSRINFIFITKFDFNAEKEIKKNLKKPKYIFYNKRFDGKQEILTCIVNDFFLYFFPDPKNGINRIEKRFFSLFSDIQIIDMNKAKQLIGHEFDVYNSTINNFIIEEKEVMKNYFLIQLSFYSLLFHRFNSFEIDTTKEKILKFDNLDCIKLKRIRNNKIKVIHIKTNFVFIMKENETKENQKNEIEFYSKIKVFQDKKIVPRLIGKIENEESLLFDYYDNFADFVEREWETLNDTDKTIIVIKIIFLLNYLHSNGFILCGLQIDSFLIGKNENGLYDVLIDDLYHFLQQDYSVSLNSNFVSPEIKKRHLYPNLNLPISYHSDIFSIGKIFTSLGLVEKNNIVQRCIDENFDNRPNSLFLLISFYCNENYFPQCDHKFVNKMIKSMINNDLFENHNRMDIIYLKDNSDALKSIEFPSNLTKNDFDVLITLLDANLHGLFNGLASRKIRDFFSNDECFFDFVDLENDESKNLPSATDPKNKNLFYSC